MATASSAKLREVLDDVYALEFVDLVTLSSDETHGGVSLARVPPLKVRPGDDRLGVVATQARTVQPSSDIPYSFSKYLLSAYCAV